MTALLPALPRRFFYAFERHRPPGYEPQIVHDEPLTKAQLSHLGTVIYKRELVGRWVDASLTEIVAEFERRRAGGNLPPDNMVPPPKPKEEGARANPGYRERFVRSGELYEAVRKAAEAAE